MAGPMKAQQTVIKSKNPVNSVQMSPLHNKSLSDITIDMTGWDNGTHGDIPTDDPSTHPYVVGFWDSVGERQEFYCDNKNSLGLRDILVSLRNTYGVFPDLDTLVTVITPRDCLGNYNKPGAVPYGCTVQTDIMNLNRYGMDVMDYGVTYQGVAGQRLESCFDEICHQYSVICRAEKHQAMHRGKRFENSVYSYYDKDQRNADNFQRYLDTLPSDNFGRKITGVAYGVDPKASELEV